MGKMYFFVNDQLVQESVNNFIQKEFR